MTKRSKSTPRKSTTRKSSPRKNTTRKNTGGKAAERLSIGDVFGRGRKDKAEEIKAKVNLALAEIGVQKNLYRTFYNRALAKARSAEAQNSPAAKDTACRELKFAYGVYRYISSLEDAYRAVQSELTLQEMTKGFAGVVHNLRKIHMPKRNVNFERLTNTALRSLTLGDVDGLDTMTGKLIDSALDATNMDRTTDSFLNDLISGRVTLDTPYAAEDVLVPSDAFSGGADHLIAMLDQINASLHR